MKKILIIHNKYTREGGEDTVVVNELELFSKKYDIELLKFQNKKNLQGVVNLFFSTFNLLSVVKLIIKILKFKPEIVYFHNLWFTASSILLFIPKLFGIKTVIKLHNYRTTCLNDLHFRNGEVCNQCSGNSFKNAFIYNCYKNSKILTLFKYLHTKLIRKFINTSVDKIVLLTNFHKNLLLNEGFPKDKLLVISNYSKVKISIQKQTHENKEGFLFVGRLEDSKGIESLIEYWIKNENTRNKLLKIAGEGALDYKMDVNKNNIKFLGQINKEHLFSEIKKAKALIFPSKWYEGRPMIIQEAINLDTIVVASNLGGILESFDESYPYHFDPFSYKNFDKMIEKIDSLPQKKLVNNYGKSKSNVEIEMFKLFDQL